MKPEEIGRSKFGAPYDVFGGAIVDPSINFRFVVWSSRKLTDFELQQSFHAWKMNQKRRISLKNKRFDVAWTLLN